MKSLRDNECTEVLLRLMSKLRAKSYVQLGELINVSPQTISTWRKRNSIPYKLVIAVCADNDIPPEAVLFGAKDRRPSEQGLLRQIVSAVKEHQSTKGIEYLELVLMLHEQCCDYSQPIQPELFEMHVRAFELGMSLNKEVE